MAELTQTTREAMTRISKAPKASKQPPIRQRRYPDWICHDCGVTYCKGSPGHAATYHIDDCQCCGAEEVPCTEPRDYGGFTQWPLPRELDPRPLPFELSDLVETVIKYFDFEKVHKAMVALRWQWFDGEGPDKIPTVDQLRLKARELLLGIAKDKKNYCTGTGGLYAYKEIGNENQDDDGLVLRFILEETEAYFGDFQ